MASNASLNSFSATFVIRVEDLSDLTGPYYLYETTTSTPRKLLRVVMPPSEENPDGRVRIPKSTLLRIQLHHVNSAVDMSTAVPAGFGPTGLGPTALGDLVTGYTQWAGTWQYEPICVDWDWGFIRNVMVFLNPSHIRTNIMLVTANGLAEPLPLAHIYMYEWVESLPWRQVAFDHLLDGLRSGS
jgi:hypothetical protein